MENVVKRRGAAGRQNLKARVSGKPSYRDLECTVPNASHTRVYIKHATHFAPSFLFRHLFPAAFL